MNTLTPLINTKFDTKINKISFKNNYCDNSLNKPENIYENSLKFPPSKGFPVISFKANLLNPDDDFKKYLYGFNNEEKELLIKKSKGNKEFVKFLINQVDIDDYGDDSLRFTADNIVLLSDISKRKKGNKEVLTKLINERKISDIFYTNIARFDIAELEILTELTEKSDKEKELVLSLVDKKNITPNGFIIPEYNTDDIININNFYQKDKRIFDIVNMKNSDGTARADAEIVKNIATGLIPVTIPYIATKIAEEKKLDNYFIKSDKYQKNSFIISNKNKQTEQIIYFNKKGIITKQHTLSSDKDILFDNYNNMQGKFNYIDVNYTTPEERRTAKEVKDKDGKVIYTDLYIPSTEPDGIKGKRDIIREYPDNITDKTGLAEKSKSGLSVIEKNPVSDNGIKSNYIYAEDSKGQKLNYIKIADKDGKILLEHTQKFKVIDENHFESEENNKKYDIQYSENKVVITSDDNKKIEISTGGNQPYEKGIISNKLLPLTKQLPGSEYFNIKNSNICKIGQNIDGVEKGNASYDYILHRIALSKECSNDLFTLLHELGHAKYDNKQIVLNKNLKETYIKEREKCLMNNSVKENEDMDYFIKIKDNSLNASLAEIVADTNALLNSSVKMPQFERRVELMQQYFPETIACAANLLIKD